MVEDFLVSRRLQYTWGDTMHLCRIHRDISVISTAILTPQYELNILEMDENNKTNEVCIFNK